MKKIVPFLFLFCSIPIQAAIYTVSFDSVPGAAYYIICRETAIPTSNDCTGRVLYTASTLLKIRAPDGDTEWIRVKAEPTDPSKVSESPYTAPVCILNGIVQTTC